MVLNCVVGVAQNRFFARQCESAREGRTFDTLDICRLVSGHVDLPECIARPP